MSGKLYLVSVSNLKKLPEDVYVKLLIARKALSIDGVLHFPSLAPSARLFSKYMNEWHKKPTDLWWEEYSKIFNEELLDKKQNLDRLRRLLNLGTNVALICFCNRGECHRYLVADYLSKYNIEVIEVR